MYEAALCVWVKGVGVFTICLCMRSRCFLDKAASSVNVKDVTICINLHCVCARRFVVRVQGGIWE